MSVTPDFIGQRYKDTNTGNIWRANSTTPGDWTLEVQNMDNAWSPTNLELGEIVGLVDNFSGIPGITSLVFAHETVINGFEITNANSVVSIEFPNLISVDPLGIAGGIISLSFNSALSSVSFPVLQSCFDKLQIEGSNLLTSISFPSLVVVGGSLLLNNNPGLTSISIPNFLPTNGNTVNGQSNALLAASVNHILARCVANPAYVSGSVILNGGTNAAPIGQGINDKATLIGRGVSVTTA